MTTATTPPLDEAEVEHFAGELLGFYTGGMVAFMVDLGHRTGLFEVAAAGSATSAQLAGRAGLEERYVREWLAAMVTAGVMTYDPAGGTYALPAEHAACLTGPGAGNLAGMAQAVSHLGKHVHEVADAFRHGGGVPYSAFRPEFTDVMDAMSRGIYDEMLVERWLPLVPGVPELLTTGARGADVGCGTGHALILLAEAFPRSTFHGYDLAVDAIERARAEAADRQLANVTFSVQDAATLAVDEPFDVVMTLDAVHDQADPAGVLRRLHDALRPGGTYLMVEPAASSRLEENIGNPLAPLLYAISTLHCMTVSLAVGGAGLGTVWGEQQALEMLGEVGFVDVTTHDAPGDPMDRIFVSRKAQVG